MGGLEAVDQDRHVVLRRLAEGEVEGRLRRCLEPGEPLVLGHPDDAESARDRVAPHPLGGADPQLASQRIAVGEEPPDEGLVDHRHARGVGGVAVSETPPAAEADAEGLEVAGGDGAEQRAGGFARGGSGVSATRKLWNQFEASGAS